MAKKDATSSSTEIVPVSAERGESAVAKAILEFVSRIPESDVPRVKGDPAEECRRIASSAAQKAALTAGSLALPPGPLGWLTVLPELVAIWRIQGQLVSDIAAAYGKTAKLGREQMLWCLFRHTAAQAFRDVAIRVGDRLVFRTTATSVLQRLAGRIGVSVSKRAVGKGISRWLPVVGALGVGAYAYYDTGQVAKTAIDLFSGEIHIDTDPDGSTPSSKASTKRSVKAAAEPPVGAHEVGDPPQSAKKKASRKTTPAATRKRATTKKTVARKTATTKTAKATKTTRAAPKKAAKKTTARRAPAKKTAARKPRAKT
jgi:chemotaxis protein histidine kinase CheA